ncbi:hypothetical protein UCRPC4_g00264 [Phaeomoniella chlamydospora]|uniref:F-box domain-containing protein n=1 Tax=Phaeomoniella chlamydospora TaxID=158046 RepID=A0A0G2HL82_PHACM|nr:hypothetical protein UCRPC4_g00264 [Phaeomoniella chlamydospora]
MPIVNSTTSLSQGIFRFFDLPSEIRDTIYSLALFAKPGKHLKIRRRRRGGQPRLSLFLVSHRMHEEASYNFYTNQVFRIFQVQDFQPLPTVRDLTPRYRELITSVELILGPGWTSPPKDWKVGPSLGLQELRRVKTLQIFVELDPSHPSLRGFRVSEDFYTNFAGDLLHDILAAMPVVQHVQIDSNPSVEANGPLVSRLLAEIAWAKCLVHWGRGPKGRASDNVFAELLPRIEPWLKPKFPDRPDDGIPYITIDEQGRYILSAPSRLPTPPPDEDADEAAGAGDLPDEREHELGTIEEVGEESDQCAVIDNLTAQMDRLRPIRE